MSDDNFDIARHYNVFFPATKEVVRLDQGDMDDEKWANYVKQIKDIEGGKRPGLSADSFKSQIEKQGGEAVVDDSLGKRQKTLSDVNTIITTVGDLVTDPAKAAEKFGRGLLSKATGGISENPYVAGAIFPEDKKGSAPAEVGANKQALSGAPAEVGASKSGLMEYMNAQGPAQQIAAQAPGVIQSALGDTATAMFPGVAASAKAGQALLKPLIEEKPASQAAVSREGQPADQGLPQLQQQPAGGGQAASMKANVNVPSGAGWGNIRSAEQGAQEAYAGAKQMGEFNKERLAADADARDFYIQKMEKDERYLRARQEIQAQAADKILSGQMQLADEYKKLQVDVDPNRFWKNKGTAEKVAIALGAGFAGYAGQGGDYIGRLDALVRADVQDQWKAHQAKVDKLDKTGGAYRDAFSTLKDMGISERAAFGLIQAQGKEHLAQMLESIASRSGSQSAAAKAQMDAGKLRESMQLDIAKAKAAQQDADVNSLEAMYKMTGQGQKAQGSELTAAMKSEYANAQAAYNKALAVEDAIKKQTPNGWAGLKNSLISGLLPAGIDISDSTRVNNEVVALVRGAIKDLEGSAIQKADWEVYKNMIPTTGLFGSKQLGVLEAIKANSRSIMQSIVDYQRTGVMAPPSGQGNSDPRIRR